jgi:DNA (cytosine-5)-methyltransferase 1
MRQATDGKYPRFVVWENVPGAFSSNKGTDFRAVLQEIGQTEIPMPTNGKWANAGMAELPQCEIAWRVLDAQYWGVPQRRRRIFLVADFATDGRCAAEILFEPESVSGNTSEGESQREGAAEGTERSIGATGENVKSECFNICSYASNSMKSGNPYSGVYRADKTRTLDFNGGNPACNQGGTMIVTAGFKAGQSAKAGLGYAIETASCLTSQCNGVEPTIACYDMTHADEVMRPVKDGIAPTLNARMGTGGNQVPVVQGGYIPDTANTLTARMDGSPCVDRGPQVVAVQGSMIGRSEKNGPQGSGLSDVCFTLNTVDRHAVASYVMTTGSYMQIEKEKSPTLMSRDYKDPNVVCVGNGQADNARLQEKVGSLNCMHDQQCIMFSKTSFAKYEEVDNTTSLRASGGDIGGGSENLCCQSFVRRLTPTECERLQGLPDGYTFIEDKSCSDSARYKALGNGMAKPCSDYVLRRLAEVTQKEQS